MLSSILPYDLRLHRLRHCFYIDFNSLARSYPELRKFLLPSPLEPAALNFRDPAALAILTRVTLQHYFDVKWWSSVEGRLCPRIPNRVNYLLWLKIFVEGSVESKDYHPIEKVIDIGTGASLIYPLLGKALFSWKFYVTQQDPEAVKALSQIINRNSLSEKITLISVEDQPNQQIPNILASNDGMGPFTKNSTIIPELSQPIDLLICNPPFFEEDLPILNPIAPAQHHTEFGQQQFFFQILKQSLKKEIKSQIFGQKSPENKKTVPYSIRTYSSLLGLKKNFEWARKMVINLAAIQGISWYRFGAISQGQSQRYIVAWRVSCLYSN